MIDKQRRGHGNQRFLDRSNNRAIPYRHSACNRPTACTAFTSLHARTELTSEGWRGRDMTAEVVMVGCETAMVGCAAAGVGCEKAMVGCEAAMLLRILRSPLRILSSPIRILSSLRRILPSPLHRFALDILMLRRGLIVHHTGVMCVWGGGGGGGRRRGGGGGCECTTG